MTIEEAIDLLETYDFDYSPEMTQAAYMGTAALRAQQETENTSTLKTTYETPESCPHCMEHLSKDWSFCPECGRATDWNKDEPLTLDELRKMDGEPVWVKTLCDEEQSGWWIAELDGGDPYKDNYVYSCDLYGKTWLAYRRKPEEG